jgi:hypothetical protein
MERSFRPRVGPLELHAWLSPLAAESTSSVTSESTTSSASPIAAKASVSASSSVTAKASSATSPVTTSITAVASSSSPIASSITAISTSAAKLVSSAPHVAITTVSAPATAAAISATATTTTSSPATTAAEDTLWNGRRRRHAPAKLSQTLRAINQRLLVAVPLERAEQATERRVELVGIHLLVRLDAVGQDLADVLRDLGGLAHVYGCAFEVARGVGKR